MFKFDYYRDHDCMKKFCKYLKEHAMKMINYERNKEMKERNDNFNSEENKSNFKQESLSYMQKIIY